MNITKESVEEQIGKLRVEQACLQQQHDQMVQQFQAAQTEFQQRVQANQNRFQQITGAIGNLQALITPLPEGENGTGTKGKKKQQQHPRLAAVPPV